VHEAIRTLRDSFFRQLFRGCPVQTELIAKAAISGKVTLLSFNTARIPEARAHLETRHKELEIMPRDGGFHPFKGRVSKHFGDSVGSSPCLQCSLSQHLNVPFKVNMASNDID
jgi:hypothetical protein